MIAPPFATLADGAVVPLTNCTACGELGRADMAHYHVCRPSESECAALRAEVGRLRAELELESELVTLHAGGASRAESRLAAANELLHLARGYHDGVDAQIDAFLAAQPAAPARTEAVPMAGQSHLVAPDSCPDCGIGIWEPDQHRIHVAGRSCKPARTDAEQAVLDAMARVSEYALRVEATEVEWITDDLAEPARAELARREAAK